MLDEFACGVIKINPIFFNGFDVLWVIIHVKVGCKTRQKWINAVIFKRQYHVASGIY
ncbi:Uncharacterised protein [Moraxella lacunata]|uniref:Uncharacterized protein n=1 Tax=Moraxella lacunata TaxID=477 RepID=A0A378TV22_MORLA|nr:Uncharacterised protein [Moraxella lacunata]